MTSTPSPDAAAAPAPAPRPPLSRRRRILRWALAIGAVLALAWLAGLAAGEWARAAAQARLVEAGLPTRIDQVLPAIDAPGNPAPDYARAFLAMSQADQPFQAFRPDVASFPDAIWTTTPVDQWSADDWAAFHARRSSPAGAALARSLEAAAATAAAAPGPVGAIYRTRFAGPATLLPELGFLRPLANHCRAMVTWHLQQGDDTAAARWLGHWQRLAAHHLVHQPFLISILVGAAIEQGLHDWIAAHPSPLPAACRASLANGPRADLSAAYLLALHGERIECLDTLLDGPHAADLTATLGGGNFRTWAATSTLYRPFRAFEHAALRDDHRRRARALQAGTPLADLPPEPSPSGPIANLLQPAYDSAQQRLASLAAARAATAARLSAPRPAPATTTP